MLISLTQYDQAHIEADICLIGAGAAGITLARELSSSNRKVVLLESGGLQFEQPIQDLYKGFGKGVDASYLHLTRLRYFGGTTNHWAGFCRPLDSRDFDEWPFGYQELVPYIQRAAALLGIHDPTHPEAILAHYRDRNPDPWEIQTDNFKTLLFQRKALNFGREFRAELESQPNLQVFTHATVTRLEFSGQGRLDAVQASTLAGKALRIKAGYFVLACGGIENARILLNSDAVSQDRSGKLGKGFSDHPYAISAEFIVPSRVLEGKSLIHWSSIGSRAAGFEEEVKLVVAPRETATAAKWPNFYLMLDRVPFTSPLKAGLGTLIQDPAIGQSFRVTAVMEADWSASNRVSLVDTRDALGTPQVQLDWAYQDREKVATILQHFSREVSWNFGGRCRVDPFDNPALGNHHIGTTCIGKSPTDSVVDINCKVHSAANLYVAGSSVFRSSGASNPTLTIIALAMRLADHLKRINP